MPLDSTSIPRNFDRWPKWFGNPLEFFTFPLSLAGVSEDERLRVYISKKKAFCLGAFTYCLPSDTQSRVVLLVKERKRTNKKDVNKFIERHEECHKSQI